MALLRVTKYGEKVLHRKAKNVDDITPGVKKLIEDMYETMYEANGIGLAAPQIGKSIRMFIVDGSPMDEEGMNDFKKVFINPDILWEEGKEWAFEEGCLSRKPSGFWAAMRNEIKGNREPGKDAGSY